MRSPEELFSEYRGRRSAILRALTSDVERFFLACDPEKENLCLYAQSDGTWSVDLPCEEVPPELPEPALGINFARDGMQRQDWLALVAVHSDSWLLSLVFYKGARFNREQRCALRRRCPPRAAAAARRAWRRRRPPPPRSPPAVAPRAHANAAARRRPPTHCRVRAPPPRLRARPPRARRHAPAPRRTPCPAPAHSPCAPTKPSFFSLIKPDPNLIRTAFKSIQTPQGGAVQHDQLAAHVLRGDLGPRAPRRRRRQAQGRGPAAQAGARGRAGGAAAWGRGARGAWAIGGRAGVPRTAAAPPPQLPPAAGLPGRARPADPRPPPPHPRPFPPPQHDDDDSDDSGEWQDGEGDPCPICGHAYQQDEFWIACDK
jgi:hypothetical protein